MSQTKESVLLRELIRASRAQLKHVYFDGWGGPDDCFGRCFSKTVGILWAAIDILCYFEPKWDVLRGHPGV